MYKSRDYFMAAGRMEDARNIQKLFQSSECNCRMIWMKAEDSNKAKAPAQKKEEKVVPPEQGLLSKLRFPELPMKQAIAFPLVILVISMLIVGFTLATVGTARSTSASTSRAARWSH